MMFRSLRVSILVVALAVIGFAALPIFPRTETASVKLHPQVGKGGTLLGESPSELKHPPSHSRMSKSALKSAAMTITIPRLHLKNVPVPTGSSQAELDRIGIMHLAGTGFPWQKGTNTFIIGHRLGYTWTRTTYVFYRLDKMQPGDEIFINDRNGNRYTFRVYDRMTVRPSDYWATYPTGGNTILSLQTCTPIPTFQNRLIVRAQLVGS